MKAKEIILLILIIAAGIFFYHAQTGKIDIFWDFDGHLFFNLEEYTFEESTEISPPLPSRLQITNRHGDVEIEGTEEEKITILLRKTIWRRNEEQAKNVSDRLKMIVSRDKNLWTITTNRGELRRKNFETHFRISVPLSMDITVRNAYGMVKVSNVASADILNPHGEVATSDIQGELITKNSYEDVRVERINASCQVESKHSDVAVFDVSGGVKIEHRYGKVRLENISQNVEIDGSHTEVFGQNLRGKTGVVTSYEDIMLMDVGPTKITGRQSTVEVDGAKGQLELTHRYGTVKLHNIQGDLFVDCQNTSVYGSQLTGEKIIISSSYRDIELAEFSGETIVTLSNGDLFLEPAPLVNPLRVEGRYCDIEFNMPFQEKYPLEARTKGGDISWKLPDEISSQEENGFTVIKAFLEEADRPSIFLSTRYGDITIEEQPAPKSRL